MISNNTQLNYKQGEKMVRIWLFILSIAMIVILSGCSAKSEPIVITKYEQVLTPIKCDVKVPTKPKFSPDEPSGARALSEYYMQVEALLKGCVDDR